MGMSQVSDLVVLPSFVVDVLNLELYRCDLDANTLTLWSNDPI